MIHIPFPLYSMVSLFEGPFLFEYCAVPFILWTHVGWITATGARLNFLFEAFNATAVTKHSLLRHEMGRMGRRKNGGSNDVKCLKSSWYPGDFRWAIWSFYPNHGICSFPALLCLCALPYCTVAGLQRWFRWICTRKTSKTVDVSMVATAKTCFSRHTS